MNHEYDVDEFEILPAEHNNITGERLTIFNCSQCNLSLSEKDLSSIRFAHAPRRHYKCTITNEKASIWSKVYQWFMNL